MTPEEFRERADAAVAPVEPDDRSFQWLTRNVAKRTRRRRLTWAAATTAAAAVAGVAVAVVPGEDARPPSLDASPSATASATASVSPSPTGPPTGDVDGDGRPDDVRIVNGSPWRVEVRGSAGRVETLAIPPNTEDGDTREIAGIEDVNVDGHAEIFVRLVKNGTPNREYLMATLVRGTLAWVRDDFTPGPVRLRHSAGGAAWGCRGFTSDLYTVTISPIPGRGIGGMVNRNELVEQRLVPRDSMDDVWPAGEPYPAEFHLDVRCGSLTAAPPGEPVASYSPRPVPVASDIDGDGKADTAEVVERGDRAKQTWQWGVRATMTALGEQTVWHPIMESSNEEQYLAGIFDVNDDGRSEVSASSGGTAFGDFFELYTVVDGQLVQVDGPTLRNEKRPEELSGWGCDMGRVAVAVATSSDGGRSWTGARTYYALVGDTLVLKDGRRGNRWSTESGETPALYISHGC